MEVKQRKLFVLTDVEPDDFISIIFIIEHFIKNNISFDNLFITTSLMNPHKKTKIIEKLLESYGIFRHDCWLNSGFSGLKEEYKSYGIFQHDCWLNSGFSGLKEEYKEEGVGILSNNEINEIKEFEGTDVIEIFDYYCNKKCMKGDIIDCLILANPFKFREIIGKHYDIIGDIYMMGGYFIKNCSYNWSINMDSTNDFFKWINEYNKKCVVYSSDMFAKVYNGYFNYGKFPEVMKTIFDSNKKSIKYFIQAIKNWDSYVTDNGKDEEMVKRIGKDNIGKQFCVSDLVCTIGYLFRDQVEKQVKYIKFCFNKTFILFEDDYGYKECYNCLKIENIDINFINKILIEYIKQ